jgi:hypothetical protein
MYFVSATGPTRSLRTNNNTLPSHLRLCSLFVASYDSQGLRWRYSNPPPHGCYTLYGLPAYNISSPTDREHFLCCCAIVSCSAVDANCIETTIPLFAYSYACLRSLYLVTAVISLLISPLLTSNWCIYNIMFLIALLQSF